MTEEKQIEEMARVLCGMASSCDKCMFKKTNCYEYQEAKAIYEADFKKQEWISVAERLPTDQKSVLCYYGFDRGDDDLGMMFVGVLCYFCFDKNPHWQHAEHNLVVTHWMPLPEPPKMKGE